MTIVTIDDYKVDFRSYLKAAFSIKYNIKLKYENYTSKYIISQVGTKNDVHN